MKNLGLAYALAAYFIWGFAPILWKSIDQIPSVEIVAHRMVWSCVLALLVILLSRMRVEFLALMRNPQLIFRLFIASVLISLNWGIYIWGVNSGNIVETAMGYFINPLINVLFGVMFFNEKLRPPQMLAIAIAAAGVVYLLIIYGELPLIALSLAITFACYGAVKKTIQVPAIQGMAVETTLMFLPALIYVLYLGAQGQGNFGNSGYFSGMLILGGAITLIPLLFFAAAAKKISLTALGMTQYLGPTLQLIIGVWIYNEPFGSQQQISFGLIWLALFIYSIDQLQNRRRIRLADLKLG
ncbi:MAG: EamA family transporter RarD [Arenicella sp.]|nr:EamA family transporter RarD [Arenicella sp.]